MSSRSRSKEAPLEKVQSIWTGIILIVASVALLLHLLLRYSLHSSEAIQNTPLWGTIGIGGLPLLYHLLVQVWRRQFGADFLAGLSIVTAIIMREPLVATIIILMFSGGQTLETFATERASFILKALARRMPNVAHRVIGSVTNTIKAEEVQVGDRLIIYPHEICPVDGTVESGTGTMDESFLTGEPFRIRKTSGSKVISGALNEDEALTVIADKLAKDSRYESITEVMRKVEAEPPAIRRLADQLGALYTPLAVGIALSGSLISHRPERFLAVIVIATPCPLLLAIPVAIIGAISLAAKRGIVIKKPVILEQLGKIHTMFFDKTGTLTYGQPLLTEIITLGHFSTQDVLRDGASLEQYSKHPLASAILQEAKANGIQLVEAERIGEKPGEGLLGIVEGRKILITGRSKVKTEIADHLPPSASGMECVVLINDELAALIRFNDKPRRDSKPFIAHLKPKHHIQDLVILSGDREPEVRHLAALVGIEDIRAGLTPEQKLDIVRERTATEATLFLGDGINDAPAMMAATVGVAFGNSDIIAQAAGAVILEPDLGKVDQLLHIGKRMRRIALESAIGGMLLSGVGMILAAFGVLPPITGAVAQELIDLLAVLNALRASAVGRELQDF